MPLIRTITATHAQRFRLERDGRLVGYVEARKVRTSEGRTTMQLVLEFPADVKIKRIEMEG